MQNLLPQQPEDRSFYILHNGKRLTLESEEFKNLPPLPKKVNEDIKQLANLLIESVLEKHEGKLKKVLEKTIVKEEN